MLGMIVALGVALAALQSPGDGGDRARSSLPRASQDSPGALIIPVVGVKPDELTDSWHDAREGGARVHEALDIMAPRGAPVVAALPGKIERLLVSARGGNTVYIRYGDWIAYYAHLAAYFPGIAEGMAVERGQQIGFVGDTGNAGAGNYHLHFALNRLEPGQKWYEGMPVDPYPLLAGPLLAGKPAAR